MAKKATSIDTPAGMLPRANEIGKQHTQMNYTERQLQVQVQSNNLDTQMLCKRKIRTKRHSRNNGRRSRPHKPRRATQHTSLLTTRTKPKKMAPRTEVVHFSRERWTWMVPYPPRSQLSRKPCTPLFVFGPQNGGGDVRCETNNDVEYNDEEL